MKLFNLVMKEIGPLFLERGLYVQSSILLDFIRNQNENFLAACRGIKRNGVQVEAAALESMIPSVGDWIYLKVIAGKEEE
jgi:hypothetical protein